MRRPSNDPQPSQSTRALNWRIEYDPDWSRMLPFCVFGAGEALRQFDSFGAAIAHYRLASLDWSDWA